MERISATPVRRLVKDLGTVRGKVPRGAVVRTVVLPEGEVQYLHFAVNVVGGVVNSNIFIRDVDDVVCKLQKLAGCTSSFRAEVYEKDCGEGRKFYHIDYTFLPDAPRGARLVVLDKPVNALECQDGCVFIPIPKPLVGTIVLMPSEAKLRFASDEKVASKPTPTFPVKVPEQKKITPRVSKPVTQKAPTALEGMIAQIALNNPMFVMRRQNSR